MLTKHSGVQRLLILVFILPIILCGQSATRGKQLTIDEQIRILYRKDPRISDFPVARFNNIMAEIKSVFAEGKISNELPKSGDSNRLKASSLKFMLKSFQQMLSHPDLEEVTGKRLRWFVKIGKALNTYSAIVNRMEYAYMGGNADLYKNAVNEFSQNNGPLKELLKKPEKIPASQLEAIKTKNIQRRKMEIQKQIRLLDQKRRTQR